MAAESLSYANAAAAAGLRKAWGWLLAAGIVTLVGAALQLAYMVAFAISMLDVFSQEYLLFQLAAQGLGVVLTGATGVLLVMSGLACRRADDAVAGSRLRGLAVVLLVAAVTGAVMPLVTMAVVRFVGL